MAAPLSRTWYDTLVDDTGTGTTGTVWNKAAVDALMDAIDASLVQVVDKSGAPAANQIAVFQDGDTVAGAPLLTTDGQGLVVASGYPSLILTDQGAGGGDQAVRLVNYGNNIYLIGLNTQIAISRVGLLTAYGGVSVGAGGGITFPASAIPHAGPTTLDEYREGPWTPSLGGTGGGSGQTYAIQTGTYTKIGRDVEADGWLHLAVAGTFTPGPIFIFNLPFTAGPVGGVVTFSTFGVNGLAVSCLMGVVQPNTNYASILYMPAAGALYPTGLPHTAIATETNFRFRASYQAAQ